MQIPSETHVLWDECSLFFLSLSHYEDVNFKYTKHRITHKMKEEQWYPSQSLPTISSS